METLLIVHLVDKTAYASSCFGLGFVIAQVDFFIFQGTDKAFGLCVVIGVALAAHADADAILFKQIGIFAGGILDAPVRMMDEAFWNISIAKSHSQSCQREIRGQISLQCPAYTAAAEGVEHDGQVDEFAKQPYVSDVATHNWLMFVIVIAVARFG